MRATEFIKKCEMWNTILPTAYFLLPTSYCLLSTVYFLLPTAYFLLPTSYYFTTLFTKFFL